MAETPEERKVRIVVDAQQPNASIKEMSAGLGVLNSQLSKMAADDPGRAKLQDDYARLNQRIQETRAEMRQVVKTAEELAEEQRQLAAATERMNQENRQVILNGQKVEATFGQMKAAATQLEKQLDDLAADDPGRAKLLADYRALKDRIEDVKQEMGEATDQGLTFKDALAFAGVAVTAEAALDLIKELGAEVIETTKEMGQMRAQINSLTGATGEELDQLTVGVRAVSQAFGKEYNEVLVASNALSKQMGISQQEALKLIEQGFIAGADVNGEFLDQVKEYPAQFKAAGVSASEFVAIVSKSQTDGVFSDKGADVVKEFGLRIREQTKATGDAMEAAFGTEFTQKLFKGINDGSISSVEALRMVSTQMNDTKIPAAQLQTVIADVFGGPGEDAGLEYLQSLRNIGGGIDTLIDQTNPYVQQQQALLASQKDLAGAQNELAKQFEGTGNSVDILVNESMTFLYTLLVSLGATFRELYEPIGQIWKQLLELGESMGLVSKEGSLAKDMANGLGAVLRLLLLPTRLVYEGFSLIARGLVEWVRQSEPAKAAIYVMIAPLRLLFDMLRDSPAFFEGFSAAAQASFGQVGKAWRAVLRGDFSAAGEELASIGGAAGRAYLQAFDAARASRPVTASATTAVGGEEPGNRTGAGGDGTTAADREKAAKDAQVARKKEHDEKLAAKKKHDQEMLDATQRWVKEDGQLLENRNALVAQRDKAGYSDELLRRDIQRQKLFDAADEQISKLTGKEADYTEQVAAIVTERDLKLRELQAGFDAETEKLRQEEIDKKLALSQAETEEAIANLGLKLAQGQLDQQQYEDAVQSVKSAAHERELALIKQKNGEDSAEYKKANAEKIKDEAEHVNKEKALDEGLYKAQKFLAGAKKALDSEELASIVELAGKKSLIAKAALAAKKAVAVADIQLGLPEKFDKNFDTSLAITKFFGFLGPAAPAIGTAYLVASNALTSAAAGANIAKVLGIGFRKGGDTGTAPAAAAIPGLMVGTNGKLLDSEGYPVAGVVHENEYVIPEWMRADPKVVQIEQFLEAKRLRGYREGGATSDDVTVPATGAVAAPETQVQLQLLEVLSRLDSRLADVEQWRRNLQVVQHTGELIDDIDYTKAVIQSAEIR